jgi:hypothetical protein
MQQVLDSSGISRKRKRHGFGGPSKWYTHFDAASEPVMSLARHLHLSRHGIFYFRIVIPHALRIRLRLSQREIKVSLRTRDRAEAMMRARSVHVKIDKLFLQLRDTMAKQPPVPMPFDIDIDPATGRIVKITDIREGEAEEVKNLLLEMNRSAPPTSRHKHKVADAVLSEIVDKYLAYYKPTVSVSTYERLRPCWPR